MLTTWFALAYATSVVVPIQGSLTDVSGAPRSGTAPVVFRLYDGESGGSHFWSSEVPVSFGAGAFAAAVSVDDALLRTHPNAWLSLEVDGVESARTVVGRVPYAAHADNAAMLGGVPAAQFVQVTDTDRIPWSALQSASMPARVRDGYTGGDGITVSPTEIAVNTTRISDLARGAAYDTVGELTTALGTTYIKPDGSGNAGVSGTFSAGAFSSTGAGTFASLANNNASFQVTASGMLTAAGLTTGGALSAASGSVTGAFGAGSLTTGGTLTAAGMVLSAGSLRSSVTNAPLIDTRAGQTVIQQTVAEADTRLYADYGSAGSWGIYHDNPDNQIHFTRQGGTGLEQWAEAVPGNPTSTTTSVARISLADGSAAFNGHVAGGGTLYGIWHDAPTGQVSTNSTTASAIGGLSRTINFARPVVVRVDFSINIQPDGNPGSDWLATWIDVDGTDRSGSGTHYQPYCGADCNTNLSGTWVGTLAAGNHTFSVEWAKATTTVSFSNNPSWCGVACGGRTMTITAWYTPTVAN